MSKPVPEHFNAFRIHSDEQGYRAAVEKIAISDQSDGDVDLHGIAGVLDGMLAGDSVGRTLVKISA